MFTGITQFFIAPKTTIGGVGLRPIHKLAMGADLGLGLTILALGILSLCFPHVGPHIAMVWKGVTLGGSSVYTGLALTRITIYAKNNSRIKEWFLCGSQRSLCFSDSSHFYNTDNEEDRSD